MFTEIGNRSREEIKSEKGYRKIENNSKSIPTDQLPEKDEDFHASRIKIIPMFTLQYTLQYKNRKLGCVAKP